MSPLKWRPQACWLGTAGWGRRFSGDIKGYDYEVIPSEAQQFRRNGWAESRDLLFN